MYNANLRPWKNEKKKKKENVIIIICVCKYLYNPNCIKNNGFVSTTDYRGSSKYYIIRINALHRVSLTLNLLMYNTFYLFLLYYHTSNYVRI